MASRPTTRSASTRDESASRAGSDAEKPIQITMSSSKKEYKIWHLRFSASVRRRDPSLLHGSHSSRPDEAPADSDSASIFSALLLPWLSDSVIEHFLGAGLDLSRQGAELLKSLERHFADSAPADDSPVEVLSAALRVQRRQFPTLGEFLRHLSTIMDHFAPDTTDTRTVLAGQLLAIHLLDELRHPPWLSAIAAEFRSTLRAPRARDARPVSFDLRAFVQRIATSAPPGMLNMRPGTSDDGTPGDHAARRSALPRDAQRQRREASSVNQITDRVCAIGLDPYDGRYDDREIHNIEC